MAGRSRSNSIDVLSDNFETVAALPATSSNAIIGNGTVEENMEGSKSNPFRDSKASTGRSSVTSIGDANSSVSSNAVLMSTTHVSFIKGRSSIGSEKSQIKSQPQVNSGRSAIVSSSFIPSGGQGVGLQRHSTIATSRLNTRSEPITKKKWTVKTPYLNTSIGGAGMARGSVPRLARHALDEHGNIVKEEQDEEKNEKENTHNILPLENKNHGLKKFSSLPARKTVAPKPRNFGLPILEDENSDKSPELTFTQSATINSAKPRKSWVVKTPYLNKSKNQAENANSRKSMSMIDFTRTGGTDYNSKINGFKKHHTVKVPYLSEDAQKTNEIESWRVAKPSWVKDASESSEEKNVFTDVKNTEETKASTELSPKMNPTPYLSQRNLSLSSPTAVARRDTLYNPDHKAEPTKIIVQPKKKQEFRTECVHDRRMKETNDDNKNAILAMMAGL